MSELTPKKKVGRRRNALFPSVQDFCRLCGCSFKVQYGSQARQTGTENLFPPSKHKGSIGVVLAKQCENRTEFVALVDGNKDITSAVFLHRCLRLSEVS